jgi:hypothetical protein
MDPDRDISIYINSPGGSYTAMTAIYDTIQYVKPEIATVCLGQAASAAAVPSSSSEAFEMSQFYSNANFEKEMEDIGFKARVIYHNTTPAILYECALTDEVGTYLTDTGALAVSSAGRLPPASSTSGVFSA